MGLGPDTDNNTDGGPTQIDNYYLLVIGIDHYQPGIKKLDNAVRDARRVADTLTKYRFDVPLSPYDLTKSRSIALYEGDATKQNILDAVKAIYQAIGENDALLIYFAGHGIRGADNDEYYLVVADSENGKHGTYMNVTEIHSSFKNYTTKKKCRDLLIILDSCYAGKALEGYGERKNEYFSRDILTSCLETQPADDGSRGHGSAFANLFVDYLGQKGHVQKPFDEMYTSLRPRFDGSGDKDFSAQRLDRGPIPGMESGRGSFIFEKTDKLKPEIKILRNSLIDHLNFETQRKNLKRAYKQKKNSLNIITTQGYSFEVQRVLSKIIFRWLHEFGEVKVNPEVCHVEEFIKIEKADSIWEKLYGQIVDDTGKLPNEKEVIHKYFFEKLLNDKAGEKKVRHVVIPIGFHVGGPEMFRSIETFCREFSELFLQEMKELDDAAKAKYGKMFIIISDQRVNGGGKHEELLKEIVDKPFNFIPTESIININYNDAKEWSGKFDDGLGQKIQDLKETAGLLQLCGDEEFEACYEEFVTKLCGYCEYSKEDVEELSSFLYGFNNKSLL